MQAEFSAEELIALLFIIFAISMGVLARCKLKTPRKYRHRKFIKLDQNGICVALLQCHESPGDTWTEVDSFRLAWLGTASFSIVSSPTTHSMLSTFNVQRQVRNLTRNPPQLTIDKL